MCLVLYVPVVIMAMLVVVKDPCVRCQGSVRVLSGFRACVVRVMFLRAHVFFFELLSFYFNENKNLLN